MISGKISNNFLKKVGFVSQNQKTFQLIFLEKICYSFGLGYIFLKSDKSLNTEFYVSVLYIDQSKAANSVNYKMHTHKF